MVAKDPKAKSTPKSPPSENRFPDKIERSLGLCVLFLLPFALTGMFVTSTCFDLYQWMEVHTWKATPATLSVIEWKQYSDEERTKERIHGQFNYKVNGVEYSSDRIFLQSGEGFPVSLRQTTRRLEPHVDQPEALTCYVNPNKPGQAVLMRDADWGHYAFTAMISLIFGSFGFLGMLLVLHVIQETRTTRNRRETLPDQPWRWNASWQQGRISAQKSRLFLVVGICAWWVIALVPSVIVATVEIVKGNWLALCVLIPFVVVLMILAVSLRRYRLARLFTAGELELTRNYFQIGSSMTANCVFPGRLFPNGDVQVRLSHLDVGRDVTGRDRDDAESFGGWDDGPTVIIPRKACEIVGDTFRFPVRVSIPAGSPGSIELHEDGSKWLLNVRVPSDIGNYAVNFELPVFDCVGDLELPNVNVKHKAMKTAQLSKSLS